MVIVGSGGFEGTEMARPVAAEFIAPVVCPATERLLAMTGGTDAGEVAELYHHTNPAMEIVATTPTKKVFFICEIVKSILNYGFANR